MITGLFNTATSFSSTLLAALPFGLKPIKYFIDSTFRARVSPVAGSVLYCDLWMKVEHSGIYINEGLISNIVVDGFVESTVMLSSAHSFTSKSTLGRKIYVSCDNTGAVGNHRVAEGAASHVGEKAFYGLIIKNCHQFSTKCVSYAGNPEQAFSLIDTIGDLLFLETWEPTLRELKKTARDRIGATKWRLWDWDHSIQNNPPSEPDWQTQEEAFRQLPLNARSIEQIRHELADTREYEVEIADERIPATVRQNLVSFCQTLDVIVTKYEEVKDFLAKCPDTHFSYADLVSIQDDFRALAKVMLNNKIIKELARNMGRAYISEEKKRQTRIPEASKSEVYGTHRSDNLQRLLPSELLNLEDEDLETLFYARLLERNLHCYELSGTTHKHGEELEINLKRTGPVVACLDTSGSMAGEPLIKAKALLFTIANMLKQEKRSLYILLFGSSGELREYEMQDASSIKGLMQFFQQGFNGGTDFDTPLRRAIKLIAEHDNYLKADILMISDGDCYLSTEFHADFNQQKAILNCSVYSVLCAGQRKEDNFSDQIVVL